MLVAILLGSLFLTDYQVSEPQETIFESTIDSVQDINMLSEINIEWEEFVYVTEEPTYTYYGTKELTAYVATGRPCADGVYPTVGYTVASNDPNLWHKWIYIEGYGDYYVHDTGGMSKNVIDIFMDSRSEAIQFGRRTAEVYVYD